MSDMWGPRARPERCNDDMQRSYDQMNRLCRRWFWTAMIGMAALVLGWAWIIGG